MRLRSAVCVILLSVATTAHCFADSPAPAATHEPTSTTTSDPVVLKKCTVQEWHGWLAAQNRRNSANNGLVDLSFENRSIKVAQEVHIDFYVDGVVKTEGTFRGQYAPGATIDFRPYHSDALEPISDPDGLTCKVSYVRFADTSEWRSSDAAQSIVDQPQSPIRITSCTVRAVSDLSEKDNLLAALSFVNRSDKAIGAVRFYIAFSDAFDTPLFHGTYTVNGHFAPGAEIEPYTDTVTGKYIRNPSSPVWALYNLDPNGVASARCSVDAVRFADGAIWRSTDTLRAPR